MSVLRGVQYYCSMYPDESMNAERVIPGSCDDIVTGRPGINGVDGGGVRGSLTRNLRGHTRHRGEHIDR
jgi:hypothetical protein